MKTSLVPFARSITRTLACAATLLTATTLHAALMARLAFDDPANLNADSSGHGHHATVGGSPTATAGLIGGAADFNGASYFKWEGAASPVVQLLNSDFTFCVWVKTTQSYASDTSWPWDGAGIMGADYPGTPPTGDTIPLAMCGSKAAGFVHPSGHVRSSSAINSGQWTHLIFVRSAGAGYVGLYVNGLLESTNVCDARILSDAQVLSVAANLVGNRNYVGSMDDLRLYDTALSEGEIAAVYNDRQAASQWNLDNLPSGLIAWWRGDGNMLDSAGVNHGNGSAAPTYLPGRFGQAFQFNGTNQGVSIPHAAELNVPATGFTVEFWMKAGKDQPQAISSIVDKDHSAQDNTGWEVSCWRDTGRLSFGIGDGSTFPLCTNLTDVLDNQFHHVAFAWDKTNWLIYVNGVLENSLYRPAIANNTRPLRFGYHWGDTVGTPMRFLKGVLDDVRVYHRALTATEIARLALGLPGANGFWGLKTHDPASQPPTTLFWFDEHGANCRELPRVTLSGAEIEADALAMSPRGELFAFQVNTSGGSRLLSLNSTSAVASVVGPVLTGRDIRGAAFTLSGRLLCFDFAGKALVEINPGTGLETGSAVPLSTNLDATTTAGDLTQMPDGSLLFAYHEFLYRLDPRTGTLTQLHSDTAPLPDGFVPFCCGVACVPGSEPSERLFAYEASDKDSVCDYLPSSGFARTLLYNHVVPGYNAGRGDLAALPAACVELLDFSVSGTNATIETVCRGGVTAWVEYTDDLSAPNWQTVPGSAGFVPHTAGSIATPKTWILPATASQRFFRVATR